MNKERKYIHRKERGRKWSVSLPFNNEIINIGTFSSVDEAREARDLALEQIKNNVYKPKDRRRAKVGEYNDKVIAEINRMVDNGHGNRSIATTLGLSEAGVRPHIHKRLQENGSYDFEKLYQKLLTEKWDGSTSFGNFRAN